MVLVEGPLVVVHLLVAGPRLRDHHHHRVRQRAAREIEQLERVVEHAGVAAVRVDDRADLGDVLAEQFRLEARLAGVHPVRVAAHRVDLAVVGDVAVRVRTIPARERVGAEARVHQRERGLDRRVVQVGEVLVELRREQHALVDERAARKADHVPGLGAWQRRGADLVVGALADHVELALEAELVRDRRITLDEYLAHERLAGACRLAEHAVHGRDRAPADHVLALGLHHLLELLLDLAAYRGIARQEDDAAAVLAGRRQRDARLAAHLLVEGVRHLDQHARPVAGVDLAAAGATVVEVLQDLDGLLEDKVRLAPLDVDHEADATGVVLELRVVEPLLGGAGRGGAMLGAHRFRPACGSKSVVQGRDRAPATVGAGLPMPETTGSWIRNPYDMRACRRQCSAAKRAAGNGPWACTYPQERRLMLRSRTRPARTGPGRAATTLLEEKWKIRQGCWGSDWES